MYSQPWYGSTKGLQYWRHQLVVEHCGKKQVSGLLYATNIDRPRLVKFPVWTDPDNPPDASGWVGDVDLKHWFPHGTKYVRVDNLPGTRRALKNRFTVVVSKLPGRAPRNNCVLESFARLVRGNVLVLRHSYRLPELVTNIHSSERQFVDLIVDQ
ncbi:hypothetical protein L226DRAFT_521839 [Lentinus tigrinus ALCF2SS1-7]|uniref:uncharacterized protein n=1 Tax=Lentinus tigrinus ALCF2SS1-7 TaxID=1328758 RepID=UPI001166017D|nr:hypothetical protein L226DRAFT_521839 [Lentinus tigrinus ALCF2SS1-7]